MAKIALILCVIATVVALYIEDRVKKEAKKIRDGWFSDFQIALSATQPHMPAINMDDAKRHSRLNKQGNILMVLKYILILADGAIWIFFL